MHSWYNVYILQLPHTFLVVCTLLNASCSTAISMLIFSSAWYARAAWTRAITSYTEAFSWTCAWGEPGGGGASVGKGQQ